MYHWEIAAGILVGISGIFLHSPAEEIPSEILLYSVRVIGTCAVFYPLFLKRKMGAGDIKLMAVCVGAAGVSDGLWIIFCGAVIAAFVEILKEKVRNRGYSGLRGNNVRLAVYLFAGYCVTFWWKAGLMY